MFLASLVDRIRKRQGDSLSIYHFLFDLALNWDEIESYEQYVAEPSVPVQAVPEKSRPVLDNFNASHYYSDRQRLRRAFIKSGIIPGLTEENYDERVNRPSDDLSWGDVWDTAVDIATGATSVVLSVSPVPTIPSWLVDFAERVDKSQDEYY